MSNVGLREREGKIRGGNRECVRSRGTELTVSYVRIKKDYAFIGQAAETAAKWSERGKRKRKARERERLWKSNPLMSVHHALLQTVHAMNVIVSAERDEHGVSVGNCNV